MKKKDLNTLKGKDVQVLVKDVTEKRAKLVKEEMALRVGKVNKLKEIRNLRHDIAQILTIIREKELISE